MTTDQEEPFQGLIEELGYDDVGLEDGTGHVLVYWETLIGVVRCAVKTYPATAEK
jgi:hypothetical protein